MQRTDPRPLSPDDPAASRAAMLKVLRAIFLILLTVFTALVIVTDSTLAGGGIQLERWWLVAVLGVLGFFFAVVGLDVLTTRRKLSMISAIFVGLIVGVIVTAIAGIVIDLFANIYEFRNPRLLEPFKIILGLGICYLTISTVLQTQDDFRLVIPYIEFAKKIRGARPLILDTSALIDGRVAGLAESGVFQAPIVVPRFVVEELQRLADSADRLKRARGRRGLDMIARLQKTPIIDVAIEETPAAGVGVDAMLVDLGRSLPGTIITTDQALRQVAAIQGVPVINLNDVAAAMKPAVIPGEPLELRIIKRGEQPGQGVGYLDDGTMVVVEDGEPAIGSAASIIVTSSMQTSAGRLIFGRINAAAPIPDEPPAAAAPEPARAADDDQSAPRHPAAHGPRSQRNPRRA